MKEKRKYSKELKLDAICIVIIQGRTCSEAAVSLDLAPQMLGRWVRESRENDSQYLFWGKGKLTAEQTELRHGAISSTKSLKMTIRDNNLQIMIYNQNAFCKNKRSRLICDLFDEEVCLFCIGYGYSPSGSRGLGWDQSS